MTNQIIWRVEVYLEGKTETYYFWNKKDVLDSIHITYSKCMDTIKIDEGPFGITVVGTDLLKHVHLNAQRMTTAMLIQDQPTHF